MSLNLSEISLTIDQKHILNDVNFEVESHQIACLLGPSGCGKTTLLRIIAGLEKGYSGIVALEGVTINDKSPQQRGFGLMFQDFALFPHLNVGDNVAFGLKMQGVNEKERQKQVSEMLNLVGLQGFEKRDVAQLSGGEKQRVALARSLIYKPSLLMLDEPLGSLDAALRHNLVGELRERLKIAGTLAVYVTHDQSEAFAIADKIVLLDHGKVVQVGTPQDLYFTPRTRFVCHFLELNNVVARYFLNKDSLAPFACIHPIGIRLDTQGELTAIVTELRFEGQYTLITATIAENVLTWREATRGLIAAVGDRVRLQIDPQWVLPLAE